MKITKRRLFVALTVWFGLFNLAVLWGAHAVVLCTAITFGFLTIVPGLLIITASRLRLKVDWSYVFYSVCLSILFLLFAGLLVNTILPLAGVSGPLRTTPLLVSLDILLAILGGVALKFSVFEPLTLRPKANKLFWGIFPAVFPVLSIFGAISLNNGGSNILTLTMYCGSLIYLGYLATLRNKKIFDTSTVAAAIFWISLALLFATSLRGWYITGHDIQREYYVFQLTKLNWHWSIALLRDPYNACLSITILPTIFASLTKINDIYIFKVLFQIIFALCPVAVYLLSRRLSNARWSLLATIYFIAFPTFLNDMPMLNRQEIGFMFFAAMLLMVFKEHLPLWQRRTLFIAFGFGVIVSHYSSTYATLGILILAAVTELLIKWPYINRLLRKLILSLKQEVPDFIETNERRFVLISMILLLSLASFTWSAQLTKTSSGFFDTMIKTIKGVSGNVQNDAKSTDTKASIFSWSQPDTTKVFNTYVKSSVESARAGLNPNKFYPMATVDQYPLKLVNEETAPLNKVGRFISKIASPFKINYILHQGFAKLLQILIAIGAAAIFMRKRFSRDLNRDFVGLLLASIVFVGLLVVLPTLTLSYGLLRAFQQILMIVALPIIIGSFVMFSFLPKKNREGAVIGLALLFFASTTGLIAEITGGYYYPLELHNNGAYYDDYYFHGTEIASIDWLAKERVATNTIQTDVEADRFSFTKIRTVGNFGSTSDILPGVVKKDSYVYLSYANVNKQRAYAVSQNDSFTYTYPIEFLQRNKDLVYSSGSSEVYR